MTGRRALALVMGVVALGAGGLGAAVTQSGELSQATWRLAPGTYELFCSMPGHLKRGMHARITVR